MNSKISLSPVQALIGPAPPDINAAGSFSAFLNTGHKLNHLHNRIFLLLLKKYLTCKQYHDCSIKISF